MIPLVLLDFKLCLEFLEVDLPRWKLLHLRDEEVVHLSASYVIHIIVLAYFLSVFSSVFHGVLALLDYFVESASVVLGKLCIHVLVLLHRSPGLRRLVLGSRRQQPCTPLCVLLRALLLVASSLDDSPLEDLFTARVL